MPTSRFQGPLFRILTSLARRYSATSLCGLGMACSRWSSVRSAQVRPDRRTAGSLFARVHSRFSVNRAGKSNLINAILGNMQLTGGTASVHGRVAFVPQKPWCQFGTLRDNILFGQPWDEARYRRVLHACALERDLDIMADGDLTEIGERGANISGGQAQRIVSSLPSSDAGVIVRCSLLFLSRRPSLARRTAEPTSISWTPRSRR